MTVTRGLTELKKLQRKIDRKISEAKWTGKNLPADPKEVLQSINDMIKEKHNLKLKIMACNMVTTVVVAGATVTVAEAIQMKDTEKNIGRLLGTLRYELSDAREKIERDKSKSEDKLQKLLESFGKDITPELIKSTSDAFWLANTLVIESGTLDLAKVTAELQETHEDFESEIDFILSESNAVTQL